MADDFEPYDGAPEQRLKAFLGDVHRVMQFIVTNRDHLTSSWFSGDTALMTQLDAAWSVVDGRFGQVLSAPWSHTVLMDAGLTGPELDFKLGLFRKMFAPFRKVLDWSQEKLAGLSFGVWEKIRKWLRELLDVINGILKSFDLVLGVEAIEEMKKALEKLLDKLDEPDFEAD